MSLWQENYWLPEFEQNLRVHIAFLVVHKVGSGIKFGASLWGKLKLVLQVIVVPAILLLVWLDPNAPGRSWIAPVRDSLIFSCFKLIFQVILVATVLFTLLSGIPYVIGSVKVSINYFQPDLHCSTFLLQLLLCLNINTEKEGLRKESHIHSKFVETEK